MVSCTCGVRLAVVLTTVLHFDRRQAERLDHLVGALAPVGGAESQDGEGQRQRGQGQGEQGARAAGHVLQHGCTGGRHRGARGGHRDQMEQKGLPWLQMEPRERDRCFWEVLKLDDLPDPKRR